MTTNWSLILNIVLLAVVVVAITRLMRANRNARCEHAPLEKKEPRLSPQSPSDAPTQSSMAQEDIIGIRKITPVSEENAPLSPEASQQPSVRTDAEVKRPSKITPVQSPQPNPEHHSKQFLMVLSAQDGQQFAGYELLQTILAAGLRFGEGQLFHRHERPNGQGPILCSLAAATQSGTFDLQNMGAVSLKGLCVFMKTAGNPELDEMRFDAMIHTAKYLADELNAAWLDETGQPISLTLINAYRAHMGIAEETMLDSIA
jgi:cell division protein ZipA